MRFLENRRDLVAAVIGALVAGLLSFAVGLYSLNKSFQLSQTKELVLGLRQDISTLLSVDREIDENLKLLLGHNYTLKADFEPLEFAFPSVGNRPKDKDFDKWMRDLMNAIAGKRFTVKAVQLPPDRFVVGSWPTSLLGSTDIDFELVQSLVELNRKLIRANAYLEVVANLAPGTNVDEASKNNLERNFPRFNAAVAEITQTKLLQLKNRIGQEVKTLQKRKDALSP